MGPRQADGIVSFMKKQALPAVSDVTAANLEEFSKADKLVAVLFVSKTTDAPAPAFSEAAEKHRDDLLFGLSHDDILFGLSHDEEAIKAAGVTPPAFVLYNSFDDPRVDYEAKDVSSLTAESIAKFAQDNSLPLIGEIDSETYPRYITAGLPLAYLFIEPDNAKKADLVKSLTPIAKKYRGKVNFVTIDAVRFSYHGKALYLRDSKWPSFAIQDINDHLKFPLDQKLTVDHDTVADFVERYVDSKTKPSLKSDPVLSQQRMSNK
jgi:protein disulfide-isomerase A1